MTDALRGGQISAQVLGLGVDPLTLATDLLMIIMFDAALFDELFAGLVGTNAEGRLVSSTSAGHKGFPCTADAVRHLLARHSVQPAGAATLALALL